MNFYQENRRIIKFCTVQSHAYRVSKQIVTQEMGRNGQCGLFSLLQWSAVRVTVVTVTVGYSDSFGNPRFITNKTPLLTVTPSTSFFSVS